MLEHLQGTCFHSARSISKVEYCCWTIRPGLQSVFQFILMVLDGVEVQASQVLPYRSPQTISVWTSLCAQGNCHAKTGHGLFQTVATKLEVQNRQECCSVKISLARTMKNSPRPLSPFHQTLHLALCIGAGSILLASTKNQSSPSDCQMVKRDSSLQKMFPLLQSPMTVSFTPLPLRLGIARGDLRLVCVCSTMETYFMKLLLSY
jgi:hypothetical protein